MVKEKKEKVLIIKTGYSEFLEGENNSRKVSLGDVLRTTCLLNIFKESHVTWVTDKQAFPLLKGNSYIDRLLFLDFLTLKQLESEEFDVVINLEKIPGICSFCDKIKSWREYGFRFDTKTGEAKAYDKAFEVLAVSSNYLSKKENKKKAQELLFEMVGEKWNGEEYILGHVPKTAQIYDVGLNTKIGQKWPTKAWPDENWDKLESMLKDKGLKVSRQDHQGPEILKNLENYMGWINSCKMIITNDSLGLHLGIVLKKKVIGLFGPTPSSEVHFYGRGKALLPEPSPSCVPCFKGTCDRERECIADIPVERVIREAEILFENSEKKLSLDNFQLTSPSERIDKSNEERNQYSFSTESSLTKEDLISFEKEIIQLWEDAKLPYFVHLSGGNEEQLMDIFKEINKEDYILSTHRAHYHYLLAGGSKERLRELIMEGNSMHIYDRKLNFLTSGIVAGMPSIAAGIALALKLKKSNKKVWCFIGDGAEDEGHTYEAIRYIDGHNLPCNFIIEDNNRSVETPKNVRYGESEMNWPKCVKRYHYVSPFPHVGTDKWVNFSGKNKEAEVIKKV